MKRLTDAEIVENYTHVASGKIDRGEVVDCVRCGKRSTELGTNANAWNRTPNKAVHLKSSVDLCDQCHQHILETKAIHDSHAI